MWRGRSGIAASPLGSSVVDRTCLVHTQYMLHSPGNSMSVVGHPVFLSLWGHDIIPSRKRTDSVVDSRVAATDQRIRSHELGVVSAPLNCLGCYSAVTFEETYPLPFLQN